MPNATYDPADTGHRELKSLPGAWVQLRMMNYGQVLSRKAMMKLSVTAGKRQKDLHGELELASEAVSLFELRCCVVDHNLEDSTGRKLDLANVNDVRILHPKVGAEIDQLISDMNNFEDEEEEDPNSKPA